jgi:hypothetical protein
MSVAYQPRGGLQLALPNNQVLSTGAYTAIQLWMYGPASSYTLSLGLGDVNVGAVQAFTIPRNSWTQVVFGMQTLGAMGNINRVAVQSTNAVATSVFFDDVVFLTTPQPLVVYADSTTWISRSQSASVNFAATSRVHSGTRSISVTYQQQGGALSLARTATSNINAFTTIRFWVFGPASSFTFSVQRDNVTLGTAASFSIPTNTWTRISFSVRTLGATGLFNRLTFQATTQPASTVFFDDISLIP